MTVLPGEFLERYSHQVSGGQCRRAAIARALMNDPRILIFDEATSAPDVTVQKQIIELLQRLQREKKLAYLFIFHNLALVQQFCDKVIVLYDGRIVENGLPDEVILRPRSEYARRLVDAIFERRKFFEILSPRGAYARQNNLLCSVQIRCLTDRSGSPQSVCPFHLWRHRRLRKISLTILQPSELVPRRAVILPSDIPRIF